MSKDKNLTESEAINWIVKHGKRFGRCVYTIDGNRWHIGNPSKAESATKSGHFWELKGVHMRIWKRCVDAKTLNPEWIVGQWCHALATAQAMDSLGKRCQKCVS